MMITKEQHDEALNNFQKVDWNAFIRKHDLVMKKFLAEEGNSVTYIGSKKKKKRSKKK